MKLRLAIKLPAMIAVGAAVTAIVVATNDYVTASNFLQRQVTENLENVRNGRRAEVHRFLARVHEDLEIMASGDQVRTAISAFGKAFRGIARQDEARAQYMQHLYNENVPTGTLGHTIIRDESILNYGVVHDAQDTWFRHIVPARGYGDLYLISHAGDVVYSVLKKDDFASNLKTGRWKDTGLAKVFRGAMAKAGASPPPHMPVADTMGGGHVKHGTMSVPRQDGKKMHDHGHGHGESKSAGRDEHTGTGHGHSRLHGDLDHSAHNKDLFADISQYLPDHGAAAGFMAVPIIDKEGYAAGALAVRFPTERVNRIMQEGSNLGETGEAYLVGVDHLFRSQPRFETIPFVIKRSVKNQAVAAALGGGEGVIETESYDGTPVLAAYGGVMFHGTKWAIISEMDLAEIRVPINQMRDQMLLIGGSLTLILIVVGILLSRTVTVPLSRVTEALKEFATTRALGDLPERARGDEIGDIAQVVHASAGEISEYIDRINQAREELKRNEDELRDREERIRSLLEVSPIGFGLVSFSGDILFTNPALIELLHLPPEADGKWEVGGFYANQDDRKRYVEILKRDGQVSGFEAEWRLADGTEIWVTLSAKLIDYDGDRAILAWIDDITERKIADQEIARKERQLRDALDSMPDGLFMLDKDGVYELFNDNYLEFCRLSELAMDKVRAGQSILPVLLDAAERRMYGEGDPNEQAQTRFDAILSETEVKAELELPNGDWYELRKKPRDGGGSIVLVSDITERRRTRDEINRQRAILQVTLETMEQGISMIDGDLNVLAKNSMFMELLEFPEEEFPGDITLEQLFRYNAERGEYGEGDIEEQVQSRLELSRTFQAHQFERTRPDGTVIDIRGNPLPDRQGFVTTYTDITERVTAAQKLSDAYEVISSSINYASRIQKAILADQGLVEAVLGDHFVMWEPRDVVGGDVYWVGLWGDGVVVLLGDCTGHGVPGAFMTLISMGALERALQEIEPGDVGALIGRMHQYIQITLRQQAASGESDDGIELGMCYFVPDEETLVYAGARFELYVVDDGDIQILKGARKGVGYRGVPYDQVYENQPVTLKPGQRFYMTTDGLIDQIGGPKGRGFGKRRFRSFVEDMTGVPLTEQLDRLIERFATYQGDEPRRDDVSVIGFEIPD